MTPHTEIIKIKICPRESTSCEPVGQTFGGLAYFFLLMLSTALKWPACSRNLSGVTCLDQHDYSLNRLNRSALLWQLLGRF
ncbi:MAG: hypothetical protein AAF766_17455 [Cyanobacteria bacterium P01_D01_bin.14]